MPNALSHAGLGEMQARGYSQGLHKQASNSVSDPLLPLAAFLLPGMHPRSSSTQRIPQGLLNGPHDLHLRTCNDQVQFTGAHIDPLGVLLEDSPWPFSHAECYNLRGTAHRATRRSNLTSCLPPPPRHPYSAVCCGRVRSHIEPCTRHCRGNQEGGPRQDQESRHRHSQGKCTILSLFST